MERLAPQFLYQVLSYLPPKDTVKYEAISKVIQKKVVENPYFFTENLGFDNSLDYDSCKEKIKIRRFNGYTMPKMFEDQVPTFPMCVPKHSKVTRLIMPQCCTEAWCCCSCHNEYTGHQWKTAINMFCLKCFTEVKYQYPFKCEGCGEDIGECT